MKAILTLYLDGVYMPQAQVLQNDIDGPILGFAQLTDGERPLEDIDFGEGRRKQIASGLWAIQATDEEYGLLKEKLQEHQKQFTNAHTACLSIKEIADSYTSPRAHVVLNEHIVSTLNALSLIDSCVFIDEGGQLELTTDRSKISLVQSYNFELARMERSPMVS